MKYRIKEYQEKYFGVWKTFFQIQSKSFFIWKNRSIKIDSLYLAEVILEGIKERDLDDSIPRPVIIHNKY